MRKHLAILIVLLSTAVSAASYIPTKVYKWDELTPQQKHQVKTQCRDVDKQLLLKGYAVHTWYRTRSSWSGCATCGGRGHIVYRNDSRKTLESPATRDGLIKRGSWSRSRSTGKRTTIGRGKILPCDACKGARGKYVDVQEPYRRIVVEK